MRNSVINEKLIIKYIIDAKCLGRHGTPMLLFGILNEHSSVTPLILLLIALVIDTFIGQATLIIHFKKYLIISLEWLIDWFDRKLNRDNRSPLDRAIRGCITSIIILLLSGMVSWEVAWLSQNLLFAWVLEIILILLLIEQKNICKTAQKVRLILRNNGVEAARQHMHELNVKSPAKTDIHGIARTTLEELASSLIINLIAPIFWYVLFGIIGLSIYHAVYVLKYKIGHKTNRHRDFGFTAIQLNVILSFIPSLLGGLLIVIASLFVPKANPYKSFKSIVEHIAKYYRFDPSISLSGFAGAFGLALGGPKQCSQNTKDGPWIGNGTARVRPQDIQQGLYLFATVCLINALWITAIVLIIYM